MKRILQTFSIASILGLILVLHACGLDQTYQSGAGLAFSSDLSAGGGPLNDGEMGVALRICYAFRSKRTKFLAEMMDNPFNFTYQTKDCSDNVSPLANLNTTLKQLMVDGPMSFEAHGVTFSYLREVQTDVNGELRDLCTQIFRGETPLNLVESNNEFVEYRFTSNIYDTVEIRYGSKPNPNATDPVVTRMTRLEVLTNQQSSGDYLGLVVRGSRFFPCEEGTNAVRTQEQNFIAP